MNKQYYYKGNKLYNVKKIDWSYVGHDIEALWKDKDENYKEKRGRFYLKDLQII